jgi:hypothetical protein
MDNTLLIFLLANPALPVILIGWLILRLAKWLHLDLIFWIDL